MGGPSRLVTSLATQMNVLDAVILTGKTDTREGSLLASARAVGAEVLVVPGLQRQVSPLADLRALLWLYRYFRREKPAIVATHLAKAGALGRLAAWLAGVRVRVHTFHGHVLEGYFGGAASAFLRTVERALARVTTTFIAISPEIAAQLEEMRIGRGNIKVIRIGLDLEPLRRHRPGHLVSEIGLPQGAELVGIVGRLVPVKAHEVFLEAAAIIARDRPATHFAIVGDGIRWDELHALSHRLGLDDRVHFTGWREDLVEVYSDLTVVVCCSHREGTPSTIIEAGAARRPVIGTRVGGMADIIQHGVNGLLVPSGDPMALASAVGSVLDDPALGRRMGEEGRRIAFARYSSTQFVKQTLDLYHDLLEAPRR